MELCYLQWRKNNWSHLRCKKKKSHFSLLINLMSARWINSNNMWHALIQWSIHFRSSITLVFLVISFEEVFQKAIKNKIKYKILADLTFWYYEFIKNVLNKKNSSLIKLTSSQLDGGTPIWKSKRQMTHPMKFDKLLNVECVEDRYLKADYKSFWPLQIRDIPLETTTKQKSANILHIFLIKSYIVIFQA